MFEHIKTLILWFLILLSIFLTVQIWTFQPEYAILKSTEYIENTPIGEEKRLPEVIKPKQVVIHQHGTSFSPIERNDFLESFYEEYRGTSIQKRSISSSLLPYDKYTEFKAVEFTFPDSLPKEVLNEIFQIKDIESFIINEIDRIVLFLDNEMDKERVHGKLISFKEQMYVNVVTNISPSKFKEDVTKEKTEQFYEVFSYEVINYGDGFKKTVYLPEESLFVNSVTYLAKPISPDHFKQTLFSDPNFVKHYFQSDGEESFTDGNRMVNVLYSGNVLRYINPTFGDVIERNSRPILFSALDFLNGHGGLTNSFYYDSLKNFGTNEEITFRLVIDGIPVYRSNYFGVNHLFEITLNRDGGHQFDEYVRPLFYVEDDPVNITKTTKIPSGHALIETLKEKRDFNRFLLTDISIGFMMIKRQSFVTFEPRWFIQYNGNWEVVDVVDETEDSEGFLNGLE